MRSSVGIPPVRKSLVVKAPLEKAFDTFTLGLDRWWPRDHSLGPKPIARFLIEPHVGGRWLEIAENGTETVVGTIIHWDRPHRFSLHWQINAQWQPDSTMKSEVDVRFFAMGPDTTTVELLHHNFETMGEEDGTSMRNAVDRGWLGILEQFAAGVEGRQE